MGALSSRTLSELAAGLVLAPERYDGRRTLGLSARRTVGDLARLALDTATPLAPDTRVLVLDTNHAVEGFVTAAHAPVTRADLKGTRRRLRPGDVLLSRLRPYLRQVAYVDAGLFHDAQGPLEVVASPEFYVLRAIGRFDAAALVPFLLAAEVQTALAAAQEGGHHPRVPAEALLALPVPDALVAASERLGGAVRADAERVRLAHVAGERRVAEVAAMLGGGAASAPEALSASTSPSPTR